ncbi:MAG: S41 family peptidase [Planctomycetaceae bacterium]|nr:S41 family peptidase [Planctomycetaceae bacterium]
MKTHRTNLKTWTSRWALACGLLLSLSLFASANDRVAVRPGAGQPVSRHNFGSTLPLNNHEVLPTTSPVSVPNYNNELFNQSPYQQQVPFNFNQQPVSPAPSHSEPSIDDELSYRYTDPRMLNFLRSTSINQLTSLYMEMSQLIDQRHVNPIAYEQRTERALASLARAIQNPTFLQAVRANGNSAGVQQVQAELSGLASRQPARSAQEALGVMQYAASVLNRSLGVPMEATALEFINGTIDSLDKYSSFVPAATAQAPSAGLEERIVGIGVELKAHDQGMHIVGVIEGGPAEAAKLQRGDIIIAINNQQLAGMSLNQAADMITGPEGTSVNLTVSRNGSTGNVTLPRRSVYVSSVTGVKMLDQTRKVGYVRLKQFSESSTKDLDAALWKLYQDGMQTLVFDLRGNPGGLLTQAISISDKFISNGSIVSTKGRNAEDNTHEVATFDRTWKIPMVVLIDENSASASEIFAAAIQENGRGVIVGRRSYGKGTVQTHFPLRTASGDLKLTTAKFYSPQGREMAGAGVTPDVNVPAATAGLEFAAEQDGDIIAAIRLADDGRPADLANRAGSTPNRQGVKNFSL